MRWLVLGVAVCSAVGGACRHRNNLPGKAIHQRLLGFKVEVLAEEMDETYEKLHLARKLQQHRIDVVPVRDVLYVSLIRSVNACGQYQGDIAFARDTVYLSYSLISKEVCTSGRVDKLTYLIDNPAHKKYKVVSVDRYLPIQ